MLLFDLSAQSLYPTCYVDYKVYATRPVKIVVVWHNCGKGNIATCTGCRREKQRYVAAIYFFDVEIAGCNGQRQDIIYRRLPMTFTFKQNC